MHQVSWSQDRPEKGNRGAVVRRHDTSLSVPLCQNTIYAQSNKNLRLSQCLRCNVGVEGRITSSMFRSARTITMYPFHSHSQLFHLVALNFPNFLFHLVATLVSQYSSDQTRVSERRRSQAHNSPLSSTVFIKSAQAKASTCLHAYSCACSRLECDSGETGIDLHHQYLATCLFPLGPNTPQ